MTEPQVIDTRIEFLDIARGIAIIMVIGVHVIAYIDTGTANIQLINFIFGAIAVPVFFLVDGFLSLKAKHRITTSSYVVYIKKSFIRLVVPWIVFSSIYILARYFLESIEYTSGTYFYKESLANFAFNAYGSVQAGQLYFLLSLFIIRLITPLIFKLFKMENRIVLSALCLVYAIMYNFFKVELQRYFYIQGGFDPILHAIWGLQFTFLGYLFYLFYVSRIFKHFNTFKSTAFFGIILVFAHYSNSSGLNVILQYTYLIWLMLVCYFNQKHFYVFKVLGRHTMAIYLVHAPIVITIITSVVQIFSVQLYIAIFISLTFTLICSFLISWVLHRIAIGRAILGEST